MTAARAQGALTHDELDATVRSLASVGGVYEAVAEIVEHYERPRCASAEQVIQQDGSGEMTLHYEDGGLQLWHGDNRAVLPNFQDAHFDSIVTDPPYELGFMGKGWDSTGIAYDVDMWRECFRVLKPGGYLLAFGGTRTWHRIAVAIEDAGFEVRDSIAWMYGSGFPKSMNVATAIDKAFEEESSDWEGWGTALKPAFEPIVMARKPLAGTVAANVLTHGTGALNIEANRVAAHGRPLIVSKSEGSTGVFGDGLNGSSNAGTTDLGRWPTNVLLEQSQAEALDAQTGVLTSGMMRAGQPRKGKTAEILGAFAPDTVRNDTYGDSGGASRFFPTFRYEAKAPSSERPEVDGTVHATVKPLELMRWLVRLVTRRGGRVLDPFAGSGTTGEAALVEGMEAVLIEYEEAHLPLILARMRKPLQVSLFDDMEGAA